MPRAATFANRLRLRALVLLALAGALGCGKGERAKGDQGADEPEAEGAEPGAASGKLRIALPAPVENEPTANLTVRLTGEHLADVTGAGDVEVVGGVPEPGRKRVYRMRAHDSELQRLEIGGRAVLVRVPPGAEMRLVDQPCFGWELVTPWLDSSYHGILPGEDDTCPAGTAAHTADSRCPAHAIRGDQCCLRTAVLSFAGSAERLTELTEPGGDAAELGADGTLEIVPGGCGFHVAKTAAGEVGLAIGFGRRWQVDIDEAGVVTGRALPVP